MSLLRVIILILSTLVVFIILTNPPIVEAKGQAMDAIGHEADQASHDMAAHQERGASGCRWYKRECHGVTTGDRQTTSCWCGMLPSFFNSSRALSSYTKEKRKDLSGLSGFFFSSAFQTVRKIPTIFQGSEREGLGQEKRSKTSIRITNANLKSDILGMYNFNA